MRLPVPRKEWEQQPGHLPVKGAIADSKKKTLVCARKNHDALPGLKEEQGWQPEHMPVGATSASRSNISLARTASGLCPEMRFMIRFPVRKEEWGRQH